MEYETLGAMAIMLRLPWPRRATTAAGRPAGRMTRIRSLLLSRLNLILLLPEQTLAAPSHAAWLIATPVIKSTTVAGYRWRPGTGANRSAAARTLQEWRGKLR